MKCIIFANHNNIHIDIFNNGNGVMCDLKDFSSNFKGHKKHKLVYQKTFGEGTNRIKHYLLIEI